MSYANEPGQGAVFRNRDKEPGDKRPALKGKARCPHCSADLQVAAWKREGKDGKPAWYSLRLQEQGGQQQAKPRQESKPPAQEELPTEQVDPEFNDPIPF